MSTLHDSLATDVPVDFKQEFLDDVVSGLSMENKRLPSKYFYDRRGSQLFDQICELDEYYPTRTESRVMHDHAVEMANCIGANAVLIELGSGSSVKTRYLLSARKDLAAYVPVDISQEHLLQTARELRSAYAGLEVHPVCADFTTSFDLPDLIGANCRRVVYFPGSTIGNFERTAARKLLQQIESLIGEDGGLLLGVDHIKDVDILEAAYDDSQGVTAEFNLNLLRHINRVLHGDFDIEQFEHHAFYNRQQNRIEMHLRSLTNQSASVANRDFDFETGETICTEYSHKYDEASVQDLCRDSNLQIEKSWTDDQGYFGLYYCRVRSD